MSDIAAELAKLHVLVGAEFVIQLKSIQVFTIKRKFALQKSFIIDFRKRYG